VFPQFLHYRWIEICLFITPVDLHIPAEEGDEVRVRQRNARFGDQDVPRGSGEGEDPRSAVEVEILSESKGGHRRSLLFSLYIGEEARAK
jgi:hypothetical protein